MWILVQSLFDPALGLKKKLEVKSQFSTQKRRSDDAARQYLLGFIFMMQQDNAGANGNIHLHSRCFCMFSQYYLKPALLSSDLISQTLLVSSC